MRRSFTITLCFACAFAASADLLFSDRGFFLDLPEGWTPSGGDGKSSYQFSDPTGRAHCLVRAWEGSRFSGASSILKETVERLKATGDSSPFVLSGREALLADQEFSDGNGRYRGYVLCADGAAKPGGGAEDDFAVIAYADSPAFEAYNDLLLSALDSFAMTGSELCNPGPVSQFYLPLAPAGKKSASLTVAGNPIAVTYDDEALEAAQTVVAREDRVLQLYANADPALALEAWKRFYRVILRDCWSRLDETAFKALRAVDLAYMAERGAAEGAPPEYAAAKLLAWTQGFEYVRSDDGTDFVNPFEAAIKGRGDCDSRALLLVIVLGHARTDSILMVSERFSHALAAFDVSGQGARFPHAGKKWLVAETTAKVPLGQIDREMSDVSGWIGVDFGWLK